MAIGMSRDEFWDSEPELATAYRKAHEYKRMEQNQILWLQGLYFYNAMQASLGEFAYGLNGGKGHKPKGYMKEPIALTEQEREIERQKRIKHTLEWVAKGQPKE